MEPFLVLGNAHPTGQRPSAPGAVEPTGRARGSCACSPRLPARATPAPSAACREWPSGRSGTSRTCSAGWRRSAGAARAVAVDLPRALPGRPPRTAGLGTRRRPDPAGELMPLGAGSARKVPPLEFLRELACVDRRYRPYRGRSARVRDFGRRPDPGLGTRIPPVHPARRGGARKARRGVDLDARPPHPSPRRARASAKALAACPSG